jgi:outer membrane protein insertion porin family
MVFMTHWRRIFLATFYLFGLAVGFVHAEDGFRISDIRVEGLQRVSPGTVFAALPLNIGDVVDAVRLQDATRTLFKSGYFDDIQLGRDANVLVVTVVERPAVASISIDGNKAIETEQLLDAMKKSGLAEGLIFKHAVLDGMAQELERQYVSQGRYGASVETEIEILPQNRVALSLKVKEGSPAAIKHINIIGNQSFEKDALLDLFELEPTGLLSFINNNDKYAKEKLEGDIERLKSWYLDRGYLRFKVDSAQVSLSPDKKSVYIVVNISEGKIYKVGDVNLAGELKVPEAQIRRLILLAKDSVFSQVLMTSSSERIKQRLGNEGYTFSDVKEITEINDADHTVAVTFYVDPQERTYVRRINFRGNTKTSDEVLRREMRQMEGAVAASYKIEQSKARLQRLGYFKSVEMETVEVPGTGDQIDLEYSVEEQASGSIGASVGFAQGSGVILGANIQQNNFLGSGKRVGFNISTSSYADEISFNYFDPYYTPDGVSRGFKIYYVGRDLDEVNISSYSVDTYGIDMNFGYPISEIEDISFGVGYSFNDITVGSAPAQEISGTPVLADGVIDYVTEACANDITTCGYVGTNPYTLVTTPLPAVGDPMYTSTPEGFLNEYGDEFHSFTLTASWRQSTLNRGRLATRGSSQSVSGELTVPGSDLEYWKLNYRGQYFRPLTRSLTLRLRTRLGYGDGYGNVDELPFYENFFAGGFGSIRGYERNTVGPRSTPAVGYGAIASSVDAAGNVTQPSYVLGADGKLIIVNLDDPEGDPFGGNVQIEGSAEIIFPLPFIKDQRSIQPALFLDGGNVFDTTCGAGQLNCFDVDLSELRYSVGLGLTWITGFGPLTFSVAKAIGEGDFDETEFFQFSLGQSY